MDGTMPALVGGVGPDWELREVEIPAPGPGPVLVREALDRMRSNDAVGKIVLEIPVGDAG
jgi:hypothetical protein